MKKPSKPEPRKRSFAMTGEQAIAEVRAINPVAMISFSRGKDAIAAYLAIRDQFERVVPYTYYVVPGLEFVEESLRYYEKLMGCHIKRMPSPNFYKMLKNCIYQPPDRVSLIASMDLELFDHDDVQFAVASDEGLDYESCFNAVGMRAKDSMMRALYFQRNGPINYTRKVFYPVFDWGKDRLMSTIKGAGWKLPIDYTIWTSSFDGLYLAYLFKLKHHFPRDYQRILHFFPLAELEIYRYEAAVAAGTQPGLKDYPTGATQ